MPLDGISYCVAKDPGLPATVPLHSPGWCVTPCWRYLVPSRKRGLSILACTSQVRSLCETLANENTVCNGLMHGLHTTTSYPKLVVSSSRSVYSLVGSYAPRVQLEALP